MSNPRVGDDPYLEVGQIWRATGQPSREILGFVGGSFDDCLVHYQTSLNTRRVQERNFVLWIEKCGALLERGEEARSPVPMSRQMSRRRNKRAEKGPT
jgi:hypothetical protein